MAGGIVLASYLAKCGVASRRASQEIISSGRVTVNGTVIQELPFRVDPERDEVLVDGQPASQGQSVYLALNKPKGYTCTAADEHAGQLALELLPEKYGRLFSVGRLDRDSGGLILFTNDGAWAQRITHPKYQVEKVYWLRVRGEFEDRDLEVMTDGIEDEGDILQAKEVRMLRNMGDSCELQMTLTQGHKREVRRLIRFCGGRVKELLRVAIGNLELGELDTGEWRELTAAEVAALGSKPANPKQPPAEPNQSSISSPG